MISAASEIVSLNPFDLSPIYWLMHLQPNKPLPPLELEPPFPFHGRGIASNSFGPNFNPVFGIAWMIPFLISIVWLGVGICQWFVLSKWTKRCERYKELKESIDEKLSNEDKS